ncbi:hypothetical protein ACTPEF_27115, partial [Clostridioides difficile]
KAFKLKYLDICGIFTHLCVSDSLKDEDVDFTNKQIECFYKLIRSDCLAMVIWPISFVLSAGLKGAGDTRYTMMTAVIGMWIF